MDGSKENKLEAAGSNQEHDRAIEEFADAAVEVLRASYHSELEPFDAYASRIKSEMIQNLEGFSQRLSHGYEVLLKELAREGNPPTRTSNMLRP